MKIAIPTYNGLLCPHFGNCEKFSFAEIDPEKKEILNIEYYTPPAHQPGLLPVWINQQGCDLIIAGGMGGRASSIFQNLGIKVITGAPSHEPEDILMAYMNGTLETGGNYCDEPGFKASGGHSECKRHNHSE